ncbi:unnamed protein product, partial [Didymodactylos carnosus]
FGYSAQGAFKYGLYEVFKDQYANMVGKDNYDKYKGLIWCAASASAEFFADIALCPLEMVKVKVQTAPHGTFPVAFGPAWSQMNAKRVDTGFPYRSLVPLWSYNCSTRTCLPSRRTPIRKLLNSALHLLRVTAPV